MWGDAVYLDGRLDDTPAPEKFANMLVVSTNPGEHQHEQGEHRGQHRTDRRDIDAILRSLVFRSSEGRLNCRMATQNSIESEPRFRPQNLEYRRTECG